MGADASLWLSLLLPLLIAAALYFIFFGKGSKASGDKVLLFGPMGSGKTALSLQLRFGKVTPTYTSLQKTVSRCQLQNEDASAPAKSITLVDMPGSGRLRSQLLSEAGAAAVLVCVLDGTQLAAQCKEASGMLFDILTVEAVQRRAPAILVVVNKSEGRGVGSPQVCGRGRCPLPVHRNQHYIRSQSADADPTITPHPTACSLRAQCSSRRCRRCAWLAPRWRTPRAVRRETSPGRAPLGSASSRRECRPSSSRRPLSPTTWLPSVRLFARTYHERSGGRRAVGQGRRRRRRVRWCWRQERLTCW